MYSSSSIVQVIKLRRMISEGACSTYGERKGVYRVWSGNLRERDHLEHTGVDGRIILRWIFRKWNVGLGTGSSWLRIGTDECGDEPLGFTKFGEFLD
jgi:hypothetical protein